MKRRATSPIWKTSPRSERHNKRLEVMWNRIEELENRSRRNNVRMIGLKEGLEAGGMIKCMYKIMSEGLGIEPDGEFEIPRSDADRGYKINWEKSEAMPISRACHSHTVTQFGFKWIPKGMKYLGVKLTQNL
ncbi:hypothetical protein QQF64_026088 [Cirrhinus molitorella]|uniref:Uncharacterized protein n=1 Tax=Cirrhinus molitorella TaxID=172907 RepID=A0ABR3NSA0_9TELE